MTAENTSLAAIAKGLKALDPRELAQFVAFVEGFAFKADLEKASQVAGAKSDSETTN